MAEIEIMEDDTEVWQPTVGSADQKVRRQWRTNRQAAYRLGYKDREGKQHPASKQKTEKAVEAELLKNTKPPKGMDWNDFGKLWDLHQEHPFTPILRKESVEDHWDRLTAENAETLPTE